MEVREASAGYARLSVAGDATPFGYKQTEVGVVPADWRVIQAEELKPFITSGSRGWAMFYSDTGAAFIRITNLRRDCIYPDLQDLRFVKLAEGAREGIRTQLQAGDVLISITADIGIVGYVSPDVPEPAYVNQHIALMRFDGARICSRYVSYFWAAENSQRIFRAMTDSGAKAGMNLTTVKQILLAVPPTQAEQEAIAEALSDADALIESLQQLIAKKRQIKQGTMQALLTGKQRLPGFSEEWEFIQISDLEKDGRVKLSRGNVISKKHIEQQPGDFPIYSSSIHNEGRFGAYGAYMFDEELITWSVDGGGNFFHRPKHKFSVTNVCGFMRVDHSRIHPRFLAFELQELHSRKKFDYMSKAHPSVIRKEYEVLMPPLSEQAAIATILTDMDTELAALETRLAKTRQLKQGMMQELLTGRIRLI